MKTIPKKRYGQHFLRDTGILNRIVGLISPTRNDLILEIGGGEGALSTRLAPEVLRLLVMEIDRDLIPSLTRSLAPYPYTEVLEQDVLHADLAAITSPYLSPGVRLRIVGNLPYNIGTAIIEKLLFQGLPIEDMIFMLQLETAERINASPGSKDYGYFSVFCQHLCETRLGLKVSPACFVPRPKVHSAMITLRPRNRSRMPDSESCFLRITRAAFAYRRKKLANSLRQDPELGPPAEAILNLAGIDGTRRAEDLSVGEYEHLAEVFRDFSAQTSRA